MKPRIISSLCIAGAFFAMLVVFASVWIPTLQRDDRRDFVLVITIVNGQEYPVDRVELCVDRMGVLHVRQQRGSDFETIAYVQPTDRGAVHGICENLRRLAEGVGSKIINGAMYGVSVFCRRMSGGGVSIWRSYADVSTGDWWSWIDKEVDAVALSPSSYGENSAHFLRQLKELTKQFEIPDDIIPRVGSYQSPNLSE